MERKPPTARGYARYYCLGRRAAVSQCPGLAETVLTGPVLETLAQSQQKEFDPETEANAARERLSQATWEVKDHDMRAQRIIESIEQGGHSALLSERLMKIERERNLALAKVEAAQRELSQLPVRDHRFGREMAARAAQAIGDKSMTKERQQLAASLARIVSKIEWSGPGWIQIHLRNGHLLAVKPEPSYFAKAVDARTRRKLQATATTN